MAPFDPEMMDHVHARLRDHGIALHINTAVTGFTHDLAGHLSVATATGISLTGDLVILAIGVRPEIALAQAADLAIGARKGIRVDQQMRTSDPHIWAVGDAVEVHDDTTAEWTLLPLAGPANRQGRLAADAIFGRTTTFRSVQGTAVCGVLGLTLAATGADEKTLQRTQLTYDKVYLHPTQHVGYYPGAQTLHLKLLFDPADARILGAQAVGEAGVVRRIDVIAMAQQLGGTVYDLEEAELCYAPQYGAAKDPVNMAGMIAANALRGDAPLVQWEAVNQLHTALLLDVREPHEFAEGHPQGAINIPLGQIREQLAELDPLRPLWVYCWVGQRAHYATRLLRLHRFAAWNLSGGILTALAEHVVLV